MKSNLCTGVRESNNTCYKHVNFKSKQCSSTKGGAGFEGELSVLQPRGGPHGFVNFQEIENKTIKHVNIYRIDIRRKKKNLGNIIF